MLGLVDRVCPLLALAGDRRTAVDGVDDAHRCHAEDPPAPLDRPMQAQVCLTPAHERCERYLAFIARTGIVTPGRSTVADGLVSTRLLVAPNPPWRGIAGRARGARPGPLMATGAGILALGIGAATVAGGMLGTAPREPTGGITDEPEQSTSPSVATRAATPSPTPRPTTTRAPSPTQPPTPVPATPVATALPTPAPTPPPARTYVVAEGDTLALIAQRFGTSVEALQAANGIEDPDSIIIGQVLVIP